jgi:hypothetical protein
MSEPEQELEPKLFESRSWNGNEKFRLLNTGWNQVENIRTVELYSLPSFLFEFERNHIMIKA